MLLHHRDTRGRTRNLIKTFSQQQLLDTVILRLQGWVVEKKNSRGSLGVTRGNFVSVLVQSAKLVNEIPRLISGALP